MTPMPPPEYVPGHGLLADKSVLITAAAGVGIGFATAQKALEEGARAIVISDIHPQRLEEAEQRLRQLDSGCTVHSKLCDVSDEQQVQELVAFAESQLNGVDILINNAGLSTPCLLVDMQDAEWDKVLQVTLYGTMRMTRCMLQSMRARGQGGAIVNNASVLGWRAEKGQSHYASAKAGVMAFTRCTALEAVEFGVRINAVAPSLVLHPMLSKSAPLDMLQKLEKREAYGRGAEAWEVANVIMFLASDYASYLTGEVISCSSRHP